MISKETFHFLKELKANNSKEWFDENRSLYTDLRNQFEHFINVVIAEISLFDKESALTTAKASIFRINRDIRFSNDKDPYKTNFGAFIAKGGRKGIHAGYYIHVEPGECFLAGGIYMPSGPMLKALREEIYENITAFKAILHAPSFMKHFGGQLWGDKLTSAPRGFPKDFPDVEYLKYKHYTVAKNEPDHIYWHPSFIDEVREVFKALEPFNTFLTRAVEEVEQN
jgi:uncharacterized protein (TIGR02453 family)